MKWRVRTLDEIADMICGNFNQEVSLFRYRPSRAITQFFRDADTDYCHDGSTRGAWVSGTLTKILDEPHPDAKTPPNTLVRVIRTLMDRADAQNEGPDRPGALKALNLALNREGFDAFYADDDQCYLRHVGTNTIVASTVNPHRPFSRAEQERRELLARYLDKASEDELIEDVLVPLFRQLSFHRVSVTGHKDKALEYGKDLWMKYTLPTQNVLYFGIQAKKGKLDSSGVTKAGNFNVAEVLNQAKMMLGKEIFDPEFNRCVLVDHAFIVAGGEITKQARNWIGEHLDRLQRSQIMFMDRDDILNLFITTNTPLPLAATPAADIDDQIPF